MHKIAVFIPYFGPVPPWIDLFLQSCRHNRNVHFHLFTDWDRSFETPANVRVQKMSYSAFCELASWRLGLALNLKTPRKICDLRPAFAEIFEVSETNLDFWGYCDLDVIFGDLPAFLTEDMLNRFDVISAGAQFISGPFALFRNTETVRRLYRTRKNYEQVLTEPIYLGFDELGPHVKWNPIGDFEVDKSKDFESFTDLVIAEEKRGSLRCFFGLNYFNDPDLRSQAKGTAVWKQGKLTMQDTGEELLFYHFQFGKGLFTSWPSSSVGDWQSEFLINADGFFPSEHAPDARSGCQSVKCEWDFAQKRRIQLIVSILRQAPKIVAAAREHFTYRLSRRQVQEAIDQAAGAVDFLSKNLVNILKLAKEDRLIAELESSSHSAIFELHSYLSYLKEQRLIDSNPASKRSIHEVEVAQDAETPFSLPEQLLAFGLRDLKHHAQEFVDAALAAQSAATEERAA